MGVGHLPRPLTRITHTFRCCCFVLGTWPVRLPGGPREAVPLPPLTGTPESHVPCFLRQPVQAPVRQARPACAEVAPSGDPSLALRARLLPRNGFLTPSSRKTVCSARWHEGSLRRSVPCKGSAVLRVTGRNSSARDGGGGSAAAPLQAPGPPTPSPHTHTHTHTHRPRPTSPLQLPDAYTFLPGELLARGQGPERQWARASSRPETWGPASLPSLHSITLSS